MAQMRIIFLDIDGVLNRIGTPMEGRTVAKWHGLIGMEPELVARFNELVRKTDAQVVLSSSWRCSDTWREDMKQNGLDFPFLDRTPYLTAGEGDTYQHLERGEEIERWICDHLREGGEIDGYAILDDDSDFLPRQPLFQTSFKDGLTEQIADSVYRHLTPQICTSCGRAMMPMWDSVAKKFTGYLWRCACMPAGLRVSVG
jgi:Swiss Army Knife RNA repair-like protein